MKYAPLLTILSYLAFSLLLALLGPVVYHDFKAGLVSFYLVCVMASITVGYLVGLRTRLPYTPFQASKNPTDQLWFRAIVVLAFAGFIATVLLFYRAGSVNLDLSAIGEAYNEGYQDYERNSGSYSLDFVIYTALAAPTFLVTIWGVYFIRCFTLPWRGIILLTVFGTPLIFTLAAGTQKNVGDLIIYMISLYAIHSARRKTGGANLKVIATVLVIALLGLAAFTNILAQRYAAAGIGADNINYKEIGLLAYNTDHVFFRVFGPDAGFSLAVFSNYITNGINGLSYALQTDATWSYMLGSSYSLSVIGERVLGLPNMYYETYPYKAAIESNWGETRWYSVFAWFASDFTFTGTVILFGFFAYVYARCWLESILYENPFSMMLFSLLSLGAVMMTANNQLMQSPAGLSTLIMTVVLYLRNRSAFNGPARTDV